MDAPHRMRAQFRSKLSIPWQDTTSSSWMTSLNLIVPADMVCLNDAMEDQLSRIILLILLSSTLVLHVSSGSYVPILKKISKNLPGILGPTDTGSVGTNRDELDPDAPTPRIHDPNPSDFRSGGTRTAWIIRR